MALTNLLATTQAFLDRPHGHVIGDQRVGSTDRGLIAVRDPASASVVAHVPAGGAGEIDSAVRAARDALQGPWGKMTPAQREHALLRVALKLEQHAEELAQLEAINQGKNIVAARAIDVGFSMDRRCVSPSFVWSQSCLRAS